MPRIARAVAVGLPHHITQRGNYGVDVFLSDEDREIYLGWLREYSDRYGVSIWAWYLMSNQANSGRCPYIRKSRAATLARAGIQGRLCVAAADCRGERPIVTSDAGSFVCALV